VAQTARAFRVVDADLALGANRQIESS